MKRIQILLKNAFVLMMLFNADIINAQQKAFIEYYDNGKAKIKGFKTINDTSIGKWIYFRNDGSTDVELIFNKHGNPQGSFKMYYRNGQLQTKGNYSGEGFYEKEGHYEEYYKNRQLQSIGVYKQNKTIGKWINYFDNGKIESLTEYTDEGVIQKQTSYYENNQLRLDARFNKNGDYVGKIVVYYNNGQIYTEEQFDDFGNKTGTYKSYYLNGKLMQIGDYAGVDHFQKKGQWKTYYKTGQLKTIITYDSKGDRIGDIKQYNKN